jgi:hypothetical protein
MIETHQRNFKILKLFLFRPFLQTPCGQPLCLCPCCLFAWTKSISAPLCCIGTSPHPSGPVSSIATTCLGPSLTKTQTMPAPMPSPCHFPLWSFQRCTSMSWTSLYLSWTSPCHPVVKPTLAHASSRAPRPRPETSTRARTRTLATLDATGRRCAPSPHSSPRSTHAHVDSPRSPQPHGHRQLAADELQTTPTTTTVRHRARVHGDDADAPVLHFQRQDACRVRGDIANTSEPSPMTLAHRSHPHTVDLPRSTTATARRYKKKPSHSISSHRQSPLPLLTRLAHSPCSISCRRRPIATSEPRRC